MSAVRAASSNAQRFVSVQEPNFIRVARTQLASRRFNVPVIIVAGIVVIQAVQLILSAFISQGAYNLAALKQENHAISTQTEILGAQVESLSSNANLSNAAHGLGMVANTTPVFLRLADQKVIGKPTAAYASTGTVARNLVPNAALTATTNVSQIQANAALEAAKAQAKAAADKLAQGATIALNAIPAQANSAGTNVAKQISQGAPLASNGGLMTSPTH